MAQWLSCPRRCDGRCHCWSCWFFSALVPMILTQTTLGLSRDDAGNFGNLCHHRIASRILCQHWQGGAYGSLVRWGVDLGRKTKPDLKTGVVWRTRWRSNSIEFFDQGWVELCQLFAVPGCPSLDWQRLDATLFTWKDKTLRIKSWNW